MMVRLPASERCLPNIGLVTCVVRFFQNLPYVPGSGIRRVAAGRFCPAYQRRKSDSIAILGTNNEALEVSLAACSTGFIIRPMSEQVPADAASQEPIDGTASLSHSDGGFPTGRQSDAFDLSPLGG